MACKVPVIGSNSGEIPHVIENAGLIFPEGDAATLASCLLTLLEYYDRLMAIRTNGDWEGWLKFFLRGIYEVSESATETARSILNLRELNREIIFEQISNSSNGLRLLDLLFQQPLVNIKMVEEYLQCSYNTASKIIEKFEELKLLKEITGWQRNRVYRYESYLELFQPFKIAAPSSND